MTEYLQFLNLNVCLFKKQAGQPQRDLGKEENQHKTDTLQGHNLHHSTIDL
jgi:hypothetical protein